MQSISIIGIGRMGGALALALSRSGYSIEHLIHRSREVAEAIVPNLSPSPKLSLLQDIKSLGSDIVLITSGDTEIGRIAERLVGTIKPGAVVLHTSGSLSSAELAPLLTGGAKTGSLHPLVSISDPVFGSDRFKDAFFCVEGDDEAAAAASTLAKALGGRPFSIETAFKPLYHASAVMACGHVVALIDSAIETLSHCGLDERNAQEALFPLIKSTIENLAVQKPAEALTGTFARADASAFERHIKAFEGEPAEEIRDIYLLLAERSLDLAEKRGVDLERIENLRSRISIAKRKSEC